MFDCDFLSQLTFDGRDEVSPVTINFILSVKERATLLTTLRFQSFDSLLTSELVLQRESDCGGSPGFFDLTIEILDFALQAKLEIICPAFELPHLQLEELCIPLRNFPHDDGPAFTCDQFE